MQSIEASYGLLMADQLPKRQYVPCDPSVDWYILKSMSMREPHCMDWAVHMMGALAAWTPQRSIAHPDCSHVHNGPTHDPVATCAVCGRPILQSPYLPGYIFVRFNIIPDWSQLDDCVSSAPKLFKVFSHEEDINGLKVPIFVPFLVKNEEISELKVRVKTGTLAPSVPILPSLIGKRIRIPHGHFMGHVAKVKSIHNNIAKLKIDTKNGVKAYTSIPLEDLQ